MCNVITRISKLFGFEILCFKCKRLKQINVSIFKFLKEKILRY